MARRKYRNKLLKDLWTLFCVREMNIFKNKIRSSYSHGTLWRGKTYKSYSTIHSFSMTNISYDSLVYGPSDKPKCATPTSIPSILLIQLFNISNSQMSAQHDRYRRHINFNNSHTYNFEQGLRKHTNIQLTSLIT